MPSRKIHRSIHEDAHNVARQIATTAAYEQSCRERKKVEMLFAHLKLIMKLDKLRLRGFSGQMMSSGWPLPPRICEEWRSG